MVLFRVASGPAAEAVVPVLQVIIIVVLVEHVIARVASITGMPLFSRVVNHPAVPARACRRRTGKIAQRAPAEDEIVDAVDAV